MWFALLIFRSGLVSTSAHAQAIPEGDFESPGPLVGWFVVDGAANRVEEVHSDIRNSRVMQVDRNNGNDLIVCSSPFTTTRDEVRALMHALTNTNGRTSWWLQLAGSGVPSVSALSFAPDDSAGPYSEHFLDATSLCTMSIEVCVEPDTNDTITYDDFLLQGAPCAAYVDGDADGACPTGQDLGGNGDCADAGEFDAGVSDCNDGNATIYPGAIELCNGVDENCVDGIDEGFDTDGDGFTSCGGDCDDTRNDAHPGAAEACNTEDDDCDGLTDEDFDLDHDGVTTCGGDCDDAAVNTFPGAPEQCNDLDDDCDGSTDEDTVETLWWPDRDHDGYGDETASPQLACKAPDDTVSNGDDCDDDDPSAYPGAPDPTVDGVDNDCDGVDGVTGEPTDTGGGPTDTDTDDTDGTDGVDGTDGPDGGGATDGAMIAVQTGCGCGGQRGSLGGLLTIAVVVLSRRTGRMPRGDSLTAR